MSVCILGSVNIDTVLHVNQLPRPGETVAAYAHSRHLGGKGANQAVGAVRAGAATTFIAATGDDEAGRWMRDSLISLGVGVENLATLEGHPSGRAFILLSASGENSIVVEGGANLAISEDLAASVGKHSAYLAQLETPTTVIGALFERVGRTGGLRILNAAPANASGRDLFAMTDILILNEVELAFYIGERWDLRVVSSLEAAVRSLLDRPSRVVVTLGAAGLLLIHDHKTSRIPGHKVDVVDTTGAGDCFCGVLAAELDRGADIVAAATFANAAAALAVTVAGATQSIPSRAAIEAFVTRNGAV